MSPRILAIDDTEHLRDVLRLTLEFRQFEVKLAADGVEGLEAARAGRFDAILCDIEMRAWAASNSCANTGPSSATPRRSSC